MDPKSRFPKATANDLRELKRFVPDLQRLVKKVERVHPRELGGPSINIEPSVEPAKVPTAPTPKKSLTNLSTPKNPIFDEAVLGNVEVTRDAIIFDNPVELLLVLRPELKPYKWQFEELMRMAGYFTTGKYTLPDKTAISDKEPYKAILSCANGSGKDMVLIAAFSVWFALKKARNRVIITSASHQQLKGQTEVHIRDLCNRANKKFGQLFKYIEFHYVCPELGSEIRLFVTDEAKRAEGWHPFGDGEMALIINEAKSVDEEIFKALSRCTGYSTWLEISSPGPRSGHMFKMASSAIAYPNPAELSQFFYRRVTAYECPCIAKSHIEWMIDEYGIESPLVRSSLLAEFADYDEPVVLSEEAYDKCFAMAKNITPVGDDIGIGLDLAGGGDEDACFVRRGNIVIHHFFFRLKDTDLAADLIDKQLLSWKMLNYVFRADNGGIGQAIIDKLVNKGWRIRRTNNQSPAYNKREFLNLGAEMYFKVKRQVEKCEIVLPRVEKLREQLTTRRYYGFDTTQGKFALESKAEALAAGRPSPDRADAFVLCFASRAHSIVKQVAAPKAPETMTQQELLRKYWRGYTVPDQINNGQRRLLTNLNGRY